jgi:hypothetical protein
MDGKGSRLEVKVERAETDGGEEEGCGERGNSRLRLRRRRGRGSAGSFTVVWRLEEVERRVGYGVCMGDGGCRGNAQARVGTFDPFSRVSLAAVAGSVHIYVGGGLW